MVMATICWRKTTPASTGKVRKASAMRIIKPLTQPPA